MNITRCIIFLFTVIIVSNASAARFSSAIEDLPLMGQMKEYSDEAVIFDKPSGRYIELIANSGATQKSKIFLYYQSALPKLGWNKKTDRIFVKNNEILNIQVNQCDPECFVKFTLMPQEK